MMFRRLAVVVGALAMVATALTVVNPAGAQTTPTCNGKPATIVGTEGPDRIEGTEGNDVIVGLGDKDIIFGRGGNDTICGGLGNDVIKGGRGNDYVEGNQGNDKLVGGIGRDTLNGGQAKDKVFGGGGPDTLIGGGKKDAVRGQNGIDTCDLDSLDFFATCEMGDVLGSNGDGTDAEFTVNVTDDFLFDRQVFAPLALQDVTERFVIEIYWEVAPDEPWVVLEIFDGEGNSINFDLFEAPEGTARLIVDGRPHTFSVTRAAYFEIVVMKRENLQVLGSEVSGTGDWVYRLATPLDAPATFTFTHDRSDDFASVVLWGPFGDGLIDFITDINNTGSVSDSTLFGEAHVVEVRVADLGGWTFSIAPGPA